jgi:hypothetical protein
MDTTGTSPESASRPLDRITQAQHGEAEAALQKLLDDNYDELERRFPPDPEGKANADPGYGSFVKTRDEQTGTLLEEYFANGGEDGELNVTHQVNESKSPTAVPGQTYERRYLIAERPDGTHADLAVQDNKVIMAHVREADGSELVDSSEAIVRAEEIAKEILAKLLEKPTSAAQG